MCAEAKIRAASTCPKPTTAKFFHTTDTLHKGEDARPQGHRVLNKTTTAKNIVFVMLRSRPIRGVKA